MQSQYMGMEPAFKSYCTTHFYSVHFLTRLSLVSNNASWTLIVSLAHIYVHFSNFQIVLSFLVYELSPSVFGIWTFSSFSCSGVWTFSSFRFFLMYEHSSPSSFLVDELSPPSVFGVWTFSSFRVFLTFQYFPPSGFWCRTFSSFSFFWCMNILLWSDVHVYDHMAIECWLLVEALATYLTHEGPFPSVRSPMHG